MPTTSTKLDINDNVKDRQNTEDVSISYFCLNVAIELQEIFVIDSQKNGIAIFYLMNKSCLLYTSPSPRDS